MTAQLKDENILCFAGEDWWFHNPHSNYHLMCEFAKTNKVLFVNSIGIRVPSTQDKMFLKRVMNKLKSMFKFLKKAGPALWVFTPIALPPFQGKEKWIERFNLFILKAQFYFVMKFLGFKRPVLWVTSPSARDIALYLNKKDGKALVYYCVDNVSMYPGVNRDFILEREKDLHKNANLAIFVSHKLLEERKNLNPNTRFLGHGVDFEHFARCRDAALPEPADMASFPRPVVGYIGEILGSDFELIRYLASQNPGFSFIFIGQPYDDVEAFDFPPNVHFLGKRPYETLPQYLKSMDCLCLYYRTDDAYNNYRNPKKLLEYLSTGKPVVSVAIHEMEFFKEYAYVAKNVEEFDRLLKKAVSENSPELVKKRMDFAKAQTWDAVAARAASYICEILERRRP